MTGASHVALAKATATLVVVPVLGWKGLALLPLAGAVALVPDVDSPESRVGHLLPAWIPRQHRGPTHSIPVAVGAGMATWLACGPVAHLGWALHIAITVGLAWLSHLVGDLPHRQGQMLLWPFTTRRFGFYAFRESGWIGRHFEGLTADASKAVVLSAVWALAVHPGLDHLGTTLSLVMGR